MKRKHAWLPCWILFVSGLTLTSGLYSQSQGELSQGRPQGKQITPVEEVDTSKFPIVDFATAKSADPKEQAKRDAKNRKYNRRHSPRITETSNLISVSSDWALRLPVFPIARSSAVIIGEITDADAHLSEDQAEIYSEFIIRIEEVLKSDGQIPLGNVMVVERTGGRIRFPSGKIVVSRIVHQDMPSVGKRYVLFLNHDSPNGGQDGDFYILTGYELRGAQVFPLDKLPAGHPIAAQRGVSEASFLHSLEQSLANASNDSR